MADEDDTTTDDVTTDGTADDAGTDGGDGDGLADKGREALRKEREARKAAAKEARELKAKVAELEAKQAASTQQDEAQQAAEQARREAESNAATRANERILRSEIKAAAADKLTDPADALAHLDLSQFEPDADGEFDGAEIAEAISDLIRRKPYLAKKASGFQGTGDGGSRGTSGPKQVTDAELKTMSPAAISKARSEGRLDKLLAGG